MLCRQTNTLKGLYIEKVNWDCFYPRNQMIIWAISFGDKNPHEKKGLELSRKEEERKLERGKEKRVRKGKGKIPDDEKKMRIVAGERLEEGKEGKER